MRYDAIKTHGKYSENYEWLRERRTEKDMRDPICRDHNA